MANPVGRGGTVVSVTPMGAEGQFSEIWTICPRTLVERAILVWTGEHMPENGDEVRWHPGHSPGWRRRGEGRRAAFLPRIGRSYDPTMRRARA